MAGGQTAEDRQVKGVEVEVEVEVDVDVDEGKLAFILPLKYRKMSEYFT